MELREFKEWLIENNFENNALFQEAITCYCNKADRAAYLLSYLAFMEYLRNCLINYKGTPIEYEKKLKDEEKSNSEKKSESWEQKVEYLKNEDKWEGALNNIIYCEKYNIFCYDRKVKAEFGQKKNNRNACVHNKERFISKATVEDLWDFIVYAKPLSMINGTAQYLMERIDEILKYESRDKYKQRASEIFQVYKNLCGGEKKNVFEQLCKKIMLYVPTDDNDFLIELFEMIFYNRCADEYEWIAESCEIECFVKLNIKNYEREIDKVSFFKWMEKEDTDWNKFNPHAPTAIMKYGKNKELKIKFLLEVYNNENHYIYWSNMLVACDDWEKFIENEKILSNVSKSENIKSLFQEVSKLYRYNNNYTRDEEKTCTFDYYNFNIDGKVARKIKLLLILAEKEKIDIANEDMKDLVKRCKLIIQDANNDYYKEKYRRIHDYLKEDKRVYSWIESIDI